MGSRGLARVEAIPLCDTLMAEAPLYQCMELEVEVVGFCGKLCGTLESMRRICVKGDRPDRSRSRPSRGKLVPLAVLAAIAFTPFLGSRDIAASHEARVAETAREMAAAGWPWNARPTEVAPVVLRRPMGMVRLEPDETAPPIIVNPWMVPLLKGEIRLQKPPLPYWCAAVLFRVFGFSEAAARLTPALLGALGTVLIYDLARCLLGGRRAWFAALLWVSTLFVPDEYRKAMADPYLAFFTLLCIWSWVKIAVQKRAISGIERAHITSSNRLASIVNWYLLIFYMGLALGLLAKGPPLLIHIGVALVAFHFCYRRAVPGTRLGHLLGIVLLLLIALPWPVYVLRHISNATELWRYESVGELSDNVENARPWWFYFPNLPLIALPWIVAWAAGWLRALSWRRVPMAQADSPRRVHNILLPPSRIRMFAALWWGILILFFTTVHLKKNPYLLPAMPAQILLMAQGLGAMLAAARKERFKGGAAVAIGAQSILGAGVALALPYFIFMGTREHLLGETIALLAIAAAIGAFVASRSSPLRGWVPVQALAFVLLALAYSRFISTPQDNERSAKRLAQELAIDAAEKGRTLFVAKLPEEVAVYVPLTCRYNASAHHVLIVRDDQEGMLARRKGKMSAADRSPDARALAGWFPDGQILFVDRVEMKCAPGDSRWKVYEVTVERKLFARKPGTDPFL